MSDIDFSKLKVAELRKLCKDKDLDYSGNKADLVNRLQENAVEEEIDLDGDDVPDDVLNDPELTDSLIDEDGLLRKDSDKLKSPKSKLEQKPIAKKVVTKLVSEDKLKPSANKDPVSKLEERAKRFGGNVSSESKKKLRAERFGEITSIDQKLKKRAERFGETETSKNVSKDMSGKLEERAKRFKLETKEVKDELLQKRKQRFAIGDDTDKKKARAIKFGIIS